MKVFKRGSTLPTVLILITLLSAMLLTTFMVVSFYLNTTNRAIKRAQGWKEYFEVLGQLQSYFEEETAIGEETVSPYEGWFSELPEEIEGLKLTYIAEDSKLDINHLSIEAIKKQGYFKKYKKSPDYFLTEELITDFKKANKKDLTGDEEGGNSLDSSFFGSSNNKNSDSNGNKESSSNTNSSSNKKDASDDVELYPELFSIYLLPNLNTTDSDKIKEFLKGWNLKAEEAAKGISDQVKRYRKDDNFLQAKGLLIDKMKYDSLRTTYFDRNELDKFYMLLDYEGTINLNLVEEDVFKLAVNLCNEKANPTIYWNKVLAERKKEKTIKNIKAIFGDDYMLYQKMFSVKSKLFRIVIERDRRTLTVILRKYKDFRNRPKAVILRTFVGRLPLEEKKDNLLSESEND